MKTCFLCNGSEQVIEFTDESFQKCKLMLLFRQKKNFKYCDITLNNETDKIHGYHLNCYKKFTALKQKYKEEFSNYCLVQTVS